VAVNGERERLGVMNGFIKSANDREVIVAYTRAIERGDDTLAKNIRANHTDLESDFAQVTAERVAGH